MRWSDSFHEVRRRCNFFVLFLPTHTAVHAASARSINLKCLIFAIAAATATPMPRRYRTTDMESYLCALADLLLKVVFRWERAELKSLILF